MFDAEKNFYEHEHSILNQLGAIKLRNKREHIKIVFYYLFNKFKNKSFTRINSITQRFPHLISTVG